MQNTNIQRTIKAFAFLCSSLVILSFTDQQPWELFASKEGGFTVMTPASLVEKVDTLATHLGEQIQHTFYHADYDGETDNFVYMVSYHDFPQGVLHPDSIELQTLFLDNTIDQAVMSLNGELVYQDAFYAPTGPGRIYKIAYNEGTAVVKSKIFLVGNRFYNARVFGTNDKDPNTDMNRFLDSFRPMEP